MLRTNRNVRKISHAADAIMPFATTSFDDEEWWLAPVTAIINRIMVLPVLLEPPQGTTIDDGSFYVYPSMDDHPDVLA